VVLVIATVVLGVIVVLVVLVVATVVLGVAVVLVVLVVATVVLGVAVVLVVAVVVRIVLVVVAIVVRMVVVVVRMVVVVVRSVAVVGIFVVVVLITGVVGVDDVVVFGVVIGIVAKGVEFFTTTSLVLFGIKDSETFGSSVSVSVLYSMYVVVISSTSVVKLDSSDLSSAKITNQTLLNKNKNKNLPP
jgi:hypothetical protein